MTVYSQHDADAELAFSIECEVWNMGTLAKTLDKPAEKQSKTGGVANEFKPLYN